MKRTSALAFLTFVLIVAASLTASAQRPNFNLALFVDDPDETAGGISKWLKGAGEADASCRTNFGLRLEKGVPTGAFLSAEAHLKGLAGYMINGGETIGYDISDKSPCTAGSPRFNVKYTLPDGTPGLSFTGGCTDQTKMPIPGTLGWTRVTSNLQDQAAPPIPVGATIQSVILMVDETGKYTLDNIYFGGVYVDKPDSAVLAAPACGL